MIQIFGLGSLPWIKFLYGNSTIYSKKKIMRRKNKKGRLNSVQPSLKSHPLFPGFPVKLEIFPWKFVCIAFVEGKCETSRFLALICFSKKIRFYFWWELLHFLCREILFIFSRNRFMLNCRILFTEIPHSFLSFPFAFAKVFFRWKH